MITNSKLGRKLRCMNITKMNKKKAPLNPPKRVKLPSFGEVVEGEHFMNFITLKTL